MIPVQLLDGLAAGLLGVALASTIPARYSYSTAFAALGVIALTALAIWWVGSRFERRGGKAEPERGK